MHSSKKCVIGLILLVALTSLGFAADLRVVVLDSKTGEPLHHKKACVTFRPSLPEPSSCRLTDSAGTATFPVPIPSPPTVYISLLTNDLVSCFSAHSFPSIEVMNVGLVVANTCTAAKRSQTPTPGTIVVFAHQMTFLEVLKSMGREL